MAGQGLECGKIKEIYAFFLGKVPLRSFFHFFPQNLLAKLLWFQTSVCQYDVAGLPEWLKKTHHDSQVTGVSRRFSCRLPVSSETANGMEAE
ncbi:MAG: hypothetical protein VYE69_08415 [Pseudomonadota bacterium]|nr:hypothetical protein [Pseudomonadota bacterium]MEC9470093.1 hypothetical protein [Pseudomonadota bacterium]MEE2865236.1 hypothetical protein [Pseudomonadota bacterium]